MISAHAYFNRPAHAISDSEEADFFAGIRLSNKTYKKTATGRLRDLDAIVIRLARGKGWHNPAVLDVGVSSGVTTLELQEAMVADGFEPKFIGTDIAINAWIVRIAPGIRVLVDSRDRPLQYELFGIGLRAWNRRLDYVTGYRLLTRLARHFVHTGSNLNRQAVKLISRRTNAARAVLEIVEGDLSVPNQSFKKRFDIIRAANILNRGYFDPEKLLGMIGNLKDYARGPGSLIVVNRTHDDGINHGTVFETTPDGGLRAVERIGSGSEIEGLMLGDD